MWYSPYGSSVFTSSLTVSLTTGGLEVRPITFDPVTRDADPLTTSDGTVLLQRWNLLERRQTLAEIYTEPSSRGVWVSPNHTQPLAQIIIATPAPTMAIWIHGPSARHCLFV